jgi:NTP pyrophosphatase (non-canonical NTP hydrolase)
MENRQLEALGTLSVDDYVDIVRSTWKDIHSRRNVLDCCLHVLDHASKLGEAIRRDDADLILGETAETANWLFGLVAKINDNKTTWESCFNIPIRLSRMIWGKYPNLCPHCFQRTYAFNEGKITDTEIENKVKSRCQYCLADYPTVENRTADPVKYAQIKHLSEQELRKYAEKTAMNTPKNLKDMENMFHRIYKSNTSIATIESIGFHILEEAGEMGRAIIDIYSKKPSGESLEDKQHDLCDEIAEVFGWLCSLTLKVQDEATVFDKYRNRLVSYVLPGTSKDMLSGYVGLEQILWVKYRDPKTRRYECPYCHSETCTCKVSFLWEN